MNSKTKKNLQLPDWYSHRKLKELFQKPQKEDMPAIVAGALILMTISYLFYHSLIVTVILAPLLVPFVDKMRNERIIKLNHEIGQQFKDVLVSVSTSQKAGYALENAFAVAYKDMKKLYGEQSPICKELRRVCKGLRNNIVLENLLYDMGERTKNSYIREFANVFAVAKRSGGNITQMLEETVAQISIQTEVEKEIDEKTVKVNELIVERPNDLKREKSLHGLTRSLLQNMVTGVSDGYKKVLEINGVGYRAAKQGKKLTLNLGYSHPIEMEDPEGIETAVEGNKITVSGIDKEKVGQYAAQIREKRAPEPYKGKGIKYDYEIIRRKVGKTGK